MAKLISFEELNLLLIEDKSETRVMVKDMLSTIGFNQVFEAADGREGLNFVDDAMDMVDVILCDWEMPSMSGISLLQQLRSVNEDVPFLMITGRNDIESVLEAKDAGVNAYITKPFSVTQLEAKLRIIHAKMVN